MVTRAWERWAVCATEDPAVFYPPLNGVGRRPVKSDPDARVWARAKQVCAGCPVLASCLEAVEQVEADEPTEPEGFRAGLTPGERGARRQEIRAQRRAERAAAREESREPVLARGPR